MISNHDHRGLNLLHCAVINGCFKVIDALITEHGLSVNEVDVDGHSPLFYAVNHDQSDCVERLLAHRAAVDFVTKDAVQKVSGFPIFLCGGRTVLHQAAERNAVKCTELILDYLKTAGLLDVVLIKDLNGFTASDIAKMEHKPVIFKLLSHFISEHIPDWSSRGIVLCDDMGTQRQRMSMKVQYRSAIRDRVSVQQQSVMTEHQTVELKNAYFESADAGDAKVGDAEIEDFDAKFERLWVESLRIKFGFLSSLEMDKVMKVRTMWFHTLQRTACDFTNVTFSKLFCVFCVNLAL